MNEICYLTLLINGEIIKSVVRRRERDPNSQSCLWAMNFLFHCQNFLSFGFMDGDSSVESRVVVVLGEITIHGPARAT